MNIVKATPDAPILLGRQGEMGITRVEFDLSAFIEAYGEGTAQLAVKRAGENTVYPVVIDRAGNTAVWDIGAAWTLKAGRGSCVLSWYVGDGLAKSETFTTSVQKSMDPTTDEDVPDPLAGYGEQVLQAAAQTLQAADRAQDAAGKAGRFYTPEVSQPDANTMQMGFTPSEPGMPALPAYRVPLPVGPEGPEGMGVVKYSFDPEIWRWVMKYTDGHINTYPGFSPHDRDKFVVWRDTFEPSRENVIFGEGDDALYENAKAFYTFSGHSSGTQYGVEMMEDSYVAVLRSEGTVFNKMVTKCHSWGAYSAQLDFKIKTPPTGAKTAGLIFNLFEGYTFGTGTILAYINGAGNAYITDNTSGSAVQNYMLNSSGSRIKVACDTWYTARLTCAVGAVSMSIWPKDQTEADGWQVECRSGSITAEVIEAQKALRIQTRASGATNLTNTVYVDNILMWEDYAPTKSEKYVHVETITTTEEVHEIKRTMEPDGTPYSFKRVRVHIHSPAVSGNSGLYIRDSQNVLSYIQNMLYTGTERWAQAVIDVSRGYNETWSASTTSAATTLAQAYIPGMGFFHSVSAIDCIRLVLSTGVVAFPVGTKIDIYGVRV